MEIVSVSSVIDLDVLLAPIAEDNPSGELLQYSGLYDELREARRADDTFSQGSWQRELKIADWRKVVSLATSALTSQTKDLQIAAWLAEALVKQYGYAGLRDSLILMRGLHENFWDTLYPEIDEGNDLEARANALEFLDRQTAVAAKEIALTSSNELSYFKWEESRNFEIPDNLESLEYDQREKFQALREQAEEEKRITGEVWRSAKKNTSRAFYEEKFQLLNECWEAFTALDQTMDDKFGNQTPGLGALKKSLDDVRTLVKKIVEEKRIEEPDAIEHFADEANNGSDGTSGNGAAIGASNFAVSNGVIRSRQDALKRLTEISDFFRQTEPHSPVSYLVQRAVKWGNMPLEQWLQDVIKDDSVLGQLRETLGVNSDALEE